MGYMLYRSFGIPGKQPDASKVGALFEGMEPQDRRGVLDSLQQIFQRMQREIQREI